MLLGLLLTAMPLAQEGVEGVFDPVAAVFYYVPGGAGWRRESYDVRSVPVDPARLRKLTSTDELMKGH